MRLRELTVTEQPVMSSWIADLTLVRGESGDVVMALGDGKRYSVRAVGDQLYRAWLSSASKGRFWHQQIKGNHVTVRLI